MLPSVPLPPRDRDPALTAATASLSAGPGRLAFRALHRCQGHTLIFTGTPVCDLTASRAWALALQ